MFPGVFPSGRERIYSGLCLITIFQTGHSDDGDTEEDKDHWGEKWVLTSSLRKS